MIGGIIIDKKVLFKKGELSNEDVYLTAGTYSSNKRLYLGLETVDDYYGDITINLPLISYEMTSLIFINGDLSKETVKQLQDKGIITNYFYTEQYNMGRYDCYSVDLSKVEEYDPKGYEEYCKNTNIKDDLYV